MSTWLQRKNQLERLDDMIRRKATGNRKELANRMGVCVRTLNNLMTDLRALGADIEYDRNRQSYCYKNSIISNWEVVRIEESKILGGENYLNNFISRQEFCSQELDLYSARWNA